MTVPSVRATTGHSRPARREDAVDLLTAPRSLGRRPDDAVAPPARSRVDGLLISSVVLTLTLFVALGRLWWLPGHPEAARPADIITIPIALICLLLLLITTIGWDRLHQRHLAEVRQRSAKALDELRHSGERRLAALMSGTSDLVLMLSQDATITYCSAASTTVLGRTPASLRGRRITEILAADEARRLLGALPGMSEGGHLRLELLAVHKDGHTLPIEVGITSHTGESAIAGFVVNVRDLSELSRSAAELARQALLDPLTGLPNRRLFTSLVAEALRADEAVTLIVVNLATFKAVNIDHGHSGGDEALMTIAARLQALSDEQVIAGRVGGDEFALLVRRGQPAVVEALCDRLRASLAAVIDLSSGQVALQVRLGVVTSSEQTLRADDLLNRADTALAWARDQRVPLVRYDHDAHYSEIDRLQLRNDLEQAIRTNQLSLEFQTIVDLGTGRVRGVEALARWEHPERGHVSPEEFVPLAEQSGMMAELGDWILREAVAAAARLQQPDHPLVLSVNISALQLTRPDFVVDLLGLLDEFGLEPTLLLLEITETAVVEGLDRVVPRLNALRSIGIHVSMDDFGTGYSSLHYLSRLPLDELKIDRSFVERLPWDAQTQSVITGMVAMAKSLGLWIVGEGIETAEQACWLEQAGCTLGQGYLFSRPLTEPQVIGAMRRLDRVPVQVGRDLPAG